MIKILTIIGARPQIIKASAISRAIKNNFSDKINEIIVHTGQHYDYNMSEVFFNEMDIPKPKYNLNIGSGNHGVQTAEMIKGIEEIILTEKPDGVIVYGDTNSTLAGAIAASKMLVPVFHIEAGLRSFNKSMPEEINRVLCDHVSTLLFTPTIAGVKNLEKEGFNINSKPQYTFDNPGVFHCGDVMYDNSIYFGQIAESKSEILEKLKISGKYVLTTIHRNANTDNPKKLSSIFTAIFEISQNNNISFVMPLHPRTSKVLKDSLEKDLYDKVVNSPLIKIIEPVSFLDMILLEKNCELVMTDSGGVQKESYFFKKNCIILRPETEWIELVENDNAIIADADKEKIIKAYKKLTNLKIENFPLFYGDGEAGEFICGKMVENI